MQRFLTFEKMLSAIKSKYISVCKVFSEMPYKKWLIKQKCWRVLWQSSFSVAIVTLQLVLSNHCFVCLCVTIIKCWYTLFVNHLSASIDFFHQSTFFVSELYLKYLSSSINFLCQSTFSSINVLHQLTFFIYQLN